MHQETWTPLLEPATGSAERLSFTTAGETTNPFVIWYAERLQQTLARLGHVHRSSGGASAPKLARPASSAAPASGTMRMKSRRDVIAGSSCCVAWTGRKS